MNARPGPLKPIQWRKSDSAAAPQKKIKTQVVTWLPSPEVSDQEDSSFNKSLNSEISDWGTCVEHEDATVELIQSQLRKYKKKLKRYLSENEENVSKDSLTSVSEVLEEDMPVLLRRQKQIDYGKNTNGYHRYRELIPRCRRRREHPHTPNKFRKCSRRHFDGEIRQWRKSLHTYDPPEPCREMSERCFETSILKSSPDLMETECQKMYTPGKQEGLYDTQKEMRLSEKDNFQNCGVCLSGHDSPGNTCVKAKQDTSSGTDSLRAAQLSYICEDESQFSAIRERPRRSNPPLPSDSEPHPYRIDSS